MRKYMPQSFHLRSIQLFHALTPVFAHKYKIA